jgi:hypothetical protein
MIKGVPALCQEVKSTCRRIFFIRRRSIRSGPVVLSAEIGWRSRIRETHGNGTLSDNGALAVAAGPAYIGDSHLNG